MLPNLGGQRRKKKQDPSGRGAQVGKADLDVTQKVRITHARVKGHAVTGGTVSPQNLFEVPIPGACECDLICKQGLCRYNKDIN